MPKYSPEQFIAFCRCGAEQLRSAIDMRKWPPGTTEKNWYSSEIMVPCWYLIDPNAASQDERRARLATRDPTPASERPADHRPSPAEEIDAHYHMAYVQGDTNAIFEYAREARFVLQHEWVIRELVEWRIDGSDEAYAKFYRFMQEYWNPTGVESPETILARMERNVAIFTAFLDLKETAPAMKLYQQLADREHAGQRVSPETVKDVVERYNKLCSQFCEGDLGPFGSIPRLLGGQDLW